MTQKSGYLISLPWDLSAAGGVNQVVKNLLLQLSLIQIYTPILHCNMYSSKKIKEQKPQIISPLHHYQSNFISSLKYYFFHYPRMVMLWVFYIKKYKIKVINIHYPVASSRFFGHLKAIFGSEITLIISLHGADISAIVADNNNNATWLTFFDQADSIVTCSNFLKHRFLSHYAQYSNKTTYIHNGIDQESLNSDLLTGRSLMPENACYFINVATFEHKKGQDILIRAYAKFREKAPESPIKLVLIGRNGGYLDTLKQLSNDLKISQHIHIFINIPHSDTMATINKSLIFLLPSRHEPFGIVLLEAGFCNVPVIANNIGGVPEVITHKHTGLLIKANCIDEWSDMFIHYQCLNLQQYSTEFSNQLSQQFTWQQATEKYLKLAAHQT